MTIRTGDWVIAVRDILESLPDGTLTCHAPRGSMGRVVETRQGYLPTIRWESTVYDCEEGYEVRVLRPMELCTMQSWRAYA